MCEPTVLRDFVLIVRASCIESNEYDSVIICLFTTTILGREQVVIVSILEPIRKDLPLAP